ncbi:MAG: CheF family chemotaxis protein [Halodesulfurarchaeum sp.]
MSVLADVNADVLQDPVDTATVSEHRVRLEEDVLVLAGDRGSERIDLEDVVDVRLGRPPLAVNSILESTTLTIAVSDGSSEGTEADEPTSPTEEQEVFFVGGKDEEVRTLGRLIYRAILNGTEVAVRHPAKIGGRSTETSFRLGELSLRDGTVDVSGIDPTFSVPIDAIVDFTTDTRELLSDERQVIAVEYVRNGRPIRFEVAIDPPRKRFILGRYLRLEYRSHRRQLSEVDLKSAERRALLRLYSMGGTATLQALLDGDSISSISVLRRLQRRGFVGGTEGSVRLTPEGWILAAKHLTGDSNGTEHSFFSVTP